MPKHHAADETIRWQLSDGKFDLNWPGGRYQLGSREGMGFGPLSLQIDNRECLAARQPAWFQFLLRGREVRADRGKWDIEDCAERKMANGGLELTLLLAGQAENSGLEVTAELRFTELPVFKQRLLLRPAPNTADLAMALEDEKPRIRVCAHRFAREEMSETRCEALRLATWQDKDYYNSGSGRISDDHAYFPRRIPLQGDDVSDKGPVLFIHNAGAANALLAYEHGSWDNDPAEDYFHVHARRDEQGLTAWVASRQPGACLEGEPVTRERPYTSVWCDIGVFDKQTPEDALFHFVHSGIAEFPASRKPMIYFNTWGEQYEHAPKGGSPTELIHEERILDQIPKAAEMGCTHFVIDYGWQHEIGEWRIDAKKFPSGLPRLVQICRDAGMVLGLWMEPLSLHADIAFCREHPEGLVLEPDGAPRKVKHLDREIHFGCLSSPVFFDYLQKMHFDLIDAGVKFFKWDWVEPDPCHSPRHGHGTEENSPQQRRQRAMFRSIEQLTALAESLSHRDPDCVVEFDVTEARRQVGLGFLAASKYFWYNFGSQDQRDEMGLLWMPREKRKQPAAYGGLIPSVLFNAANTATSRRGSRIMRYNAHSSILGMGGFWGSLDDVEPHDRKEIAFIVKDYKRLGDAITAAPLRLTGQPGSSPEIYETLNGSTGQIVAFTEKTLRADYETRQLNPEEFFLVTETPYQLRQDGRLLIHFDLAEWSSAHAHVWDRAHAACPLPVHAVLAASKGIFRWESRDRSFLLHPYFGNEAIFRLRLDKNAGFKILQGKELRTVQEGEHYFDIEAGNIALSPLEIRFE